MLKAENTYNNIDFLSFSHPLRLETVYDNRNYIELCKEVFAQEVFEVKTINVSSTLNGQDMHIIISKNFLSIQFRATFFMRYGDALARIRALINLFNTKHRDINNLAVPVVIARIDICRDFAEIIPEDLAKYLKKKKVYKKKFLPPRYSPIGRLDYPAETENFISSKYHLRIYCKTIQAKKFTDEFRKSWVAKMGYVDRLITRFELELRDSKRLKDITFNFYNSAVSLETLIQSAMRDFYLTHKIFNKSNVEEKNWKNLFILSKNISLKRPRTFSNKYLDFGFKSLMTDKICIKRYLTLQLDDEEIDEEKLRKNLLKDFDEQKNDLEEKRRLKQFRQAITTDYFNQILKFGEILLSDSESDIKKAA
jgi:hypothetical protein